jgi:hypothetical protein
MMKREMTMMRKREMSLKTRMMKIEWEEDRTFNSGKMIRLIS